MKILFAILSLFGIHAAGPKIQEPVIIPIAQVASSTSDNMADLPVKTAEKSAKNIKISAKATVVPVDHAASTAIDPTPTLAHAPVFPDTTTVPIEASAPEEKKKNIPPELNQHLNDKIISKWGTREHWIDNQKDIKINGVMPDFIDSKDGSHSYRLTVYGSNLKDSQVYMIGKTCNLFGNLQGQTLIEMPDDQYVNDPSPCQPNTMVSQSDDGTSIVFQFYDYNPSVTSSDSSGNITKAFTFLLVKKSDYSSGASLPSSANAFTVYGN